MSELDFSNVSLAHIQEDPNVIYRLGDGVVPEMAHAFGYELDAQANADNMHGFVGAVGKDPVLRGSNERQVLDVIEDTVNTTAGWVDQSGILVPWNRTLWDAEKPASTDGVMIMMAGVPRWVARSVEIIKNAPNKEAIIAAGGRVMNSEKDLENPIVQGFAEKFGRVPTEAEFIEQQYREELEAAGKNVRTLTTTETASWNILPAMFKQFPDLLDSEIVAARVAGNAPIMGLQLRKAAHEVYGVDAYDTQDNPQISVLSDEATLARTEEEAKDPANYQSPITGSRNIPVFGKEAVSQKFAI